MLDLSVGHMYATRYNTTLCITCVACKVGSHETVAMQLFRAVNTGSFFLIVEPDGLAHSVSK